MKQGITPEEWDSARRMMDAVNLHVHARLAAGGDAPPGYVAICLADGKDPDGVMYDRRADVFRHHPFETNVMAIKVGMETMPAREAVIVLQMNRWAYKAGVIFSEEEPVAPQLSELMSTFIPRTLRGLKN